MAKINYKQALAALGIAGIIAAAFTAPHEGVKFKSYRDSGGVWTIGRGHTQGVYEGMEVTKDQVDAWYLSDEKTAKDAFNRLVKRPQHPNVAASAIDFIFNAGAGNFSSSTLRRKLNAGDRAGACNQYPRWRNAGGKDCRIEANNCSGVIARREAEKELCLSDELVICDYFSGHCEPIGIRPAQHLDQPAGSEAQG